MSIGDFCKERVVDTQEGNIECCDHVIKISGQEGSSAVTVACKTLPTHAAQAGCYFPQDDNPERIEVGNGYWITFTDPTRTRICYAPSCAPAPGFTGSWTASDHPDIHGTP
jgi:hypothetical protein